LTLPASLEVAYATVVGELGMASAAWILVEEVVRDAGEEGAHELASRLGAQYPVLDAIAAAWLQGARPPKVEVAGVLQAARGVEDLVIVGLETRYLDALAAAAPPEMRLWLIASRPFTTDWDRVLSNYGGRVGLLPLDEFQRAAGPRSALLGFVYGMHAGRAHVPLLWARVLGEDVRSQFRSLIGWDVLGSPMNRYPRWLTEIDAGDLTELVGAS
jgi:hypothetical protein